MDADKGSGKTSSSPFSTASKMARATDSREALGISRPWVMSVSTGPARTAWTRTPRPASRARSDWVRLNAAALETEAARDDWQLRVRPRHSLREVDQHLADVLAVKDA